MHTILEDSYNTIIIGGGIAGCICASKLKDRSILIIDANEKLMKKIYATGNGRCNLTNKYLDVKRYNSDCKKIVENIYKQRDYKSFIDYLNKIGLFTVEVDGLYYPNNFCASSVVDAITNQLKDVDILLDYEVNKVDDCHVYVGKKRIKYKNLVLACGSKASNINKIKGNPYKLVDSPLKECSASLCALKSSKKYLSKLSGVRANTRASLYVDNSLVISEIGQTQFKKDGISGIQIFQFSSIINGIKNYSKIEVGLDYIYNLNEVEVKHSLESKDDILKSLSYIIHPKIAQVLYYISVRDEDSKAEKVDRLIRIMKNHRINITGMDSIENAQVVSGGYKLENLDCNLKLKDRNIYIIGELLNVDGICGGYNIQWAYSSSTKVAEVINDKGIKH